MLKQYVLRTTSWCATDQLFSPLFKQRLVHCVVDFISGRYLHGSYMCITLYIDKIYRLNVTSSLIGSSILTEDVWAYSLWLGYIPLPPYNEHLWWSGTVKQNTGYWGNHGAMAGKRQPESLDTQNEDGAAFDRPLPWSHVTKLTRPSWYSEQDVTPSTNVMTI